MTVLAPWPTLLVEADFANEPTDGVKVGSRTWTDITSYVRGATWTRDGRTAETERTQAGSCTITLSNRYNGSTGYPFDKSNTLSPFNANGALSWSFLVRISLVYAGSTERQWTGTKETLNLGRPGSGKDSIATLNGVSLMKGLELFPLAGNTLALGSASDRVTDIAALIPIPDTTIDTTTTSTLVFPQAVFASDDTTSALAHLQQVEQDERGLIFTGRGGALNFQGRFYRANLIPSGPTANIGETDTLNTIRYVEGAPSDDNSYLWNTVAVTPAGGPTQIASDTVSEAENYQRRLDLSMLVTDTASAMANAHWYANRYGQPPQRLPQLEILGARKPSTWLTIIRAKNSDLFGWFGGADAIDVFLERVSMTYSLAPGEPRLRVFWDTSPSIRDGVWKLGVAGESELGITTRLG